jgi:hypothetical protein
MSDESTAGRGGGFIEQIRARYPPELAEKIVERIQHRDDVDNAEAAVQDAAGSLGMEFALHRGEIDPEQAFQHLDRLLEDHPEYFDRDE